MITLCNAFSLNMLPPGTDITTLQIERIPESVALENLRYRKEWKSAIGHADTARILSEMAGVEIPVSRVNIQIRPGDILLVAQYSGPRLSEGATVLPPGSRIEWFSVVVTG